MKPSVCPVCSGRGFMSKSFYSSYFTYSTAVESNNEQCRSCQGLGYIWNIGCNKKHCECAKKNGTITIWNDYPSTTTATTVTSNVEICDVK